MMTLRPDRPPIGIALVAAALLVAACGAVQAQPAPQPAQPAGGRVVVSGTVPDEATRAAILAKVREVYGVERVVDQLGVGNLVAPPKWSEQVQKLITPELKRVTQGQLKVTGNLVELVGSVDGESRRTDVARGMTSALANPTYTVRNGLRVGTPGQEQLDAALANRIVEFEPGNAQLTNAGARVLDELLPVLKKFVDRRFEVVGHTDAAGGRQQNTALSLARAEAVKAYLVERGIAAAQISTAGAGSERPVADNGTAEGRARNRRIEFRVLA